MSRFFRIAAVTARPFLRFWNADGAGGGPGTYFSPGGAPLDVTFGPTQLSPLGPNYLGVTLGAKSFQIPASEKLWVGIGFDDANGATGATPAQLRNLGFSLFDPPTVGSSADAMLLTNTPGSFLGVNDPAVFHWFELKRSGGRVEWISRQFDHNSGPGTQFEIADMNGDGLADVIASNKKGVHLFVQTK